MRYVPFLLACSICECALAQFTGFRERTDPGPFMWDVSLVQSHVLFDQEGDGDLDYLVFSQNANGSVATLSWNLGQGLFRLGSPPPSPGGQVWSATTIDVDGDGDDDMALGVALSPGPGSTLQIWSNTTNGLAMLGAGPFIGWDAILGMAVADVDGDGDQDLAAITIYESGQQLKVFRNDGVGSFQEDPAAVPPNTTGGREIQFADLDGDLDVDLYVAAPYGDQILENDGTGVFRRSTTALAGANAPRSESVTLLDGDGDGDTDAVIVGAHNWGTYARFLMNDGTGSFTHVPSILPMEGRAFQRVHRADVDGDLDEDFLLIPGSGPALIGLIGTLPFQLVPCGSPLSTHGLVGDLDGDGDADFIEGRNFGPFVHLLDPNLQYHRLWDDQELATPAQPHVADLDGDGALELYTVDTHFTAYFLAKPGELGEVVREERLRLTPGYGLYVPDEHAVADFDGDGDPDLLVTKIQLQIPGGFVAAADDLYLNDGSGSFTSVTVTHVPPVLTYFVSLDVADLDGDGDLDVWGHQTDGGNLILENDGSGVFRHRNPGPASPGEQVLLGDLDSDGDVDAVIHGGIRIEALINLGNLRFQRDMNRFPSTPYASKDGVLADFDGDGLLDLFLGNDGRNELLLNSSAGFFTPSSSTGLLPADATRHVLCADFDENGWSDVLVMNLDRSDAPAYVLLNRGGTLTLHPWRWTSGYWFGGGGTVGDMDGDLDVDLILSHAGLGAALFQNLLRGLRSPLPPRLGKDHFLEVYGPVGAAFVLAFGTTRGDLDLGTAGHLLLDPTQAWLVLSGLIAPGGPTDVRFPIPAITSLIGSEAHWQVAFASPLRLTSAVSERIRDW